MNKIDENERLALMTAYERPYWERGIAVAGMDEAGRGPLAGPVVAACVMLPCNLLIPGVNDSKKLSPKKRETLYEIIIENALGSGTGWVYEDIIDEINILNAARLAFGNAYKNMNRACEAVFIDALTGVDTAAAQHIIVHGDALCYSIAAASIIAKVERDRYMTEIALKYPEYGFEKHKGYGTRQHIEAIKKYGPCEIHRRSFIKNFV